MTTNQYHNACANLYKVAGKEVEFKYIDPRGKESIKRGVLLGVGTMANKDNFIIGWAGHSLAIHYSRVNF